VDLARFGEEGWRVSKDGVEDNSRDLLDILAGKVS
jgi:hypothetical protein